MLLNQVADALYPAVNQLGVTPTDQLRYNARLARETGKTIVSAIKETAEETRELTTGSKARKLLWGTGLTAYTLGDDFIAGGVYSVAETTHGKMFAIAVVGTLASAAAKRLATIQRNRMISNASAKGTELKVVDRSIGVDAASTYGIGVPATTLSYPSGTIPSKRRVNEASLFYGFAGQGASYAGFEVLGSAIGIHPKVMLAVGITAAGGARFMKDTINDFDAMSRVMGIEQSPVEFAVWAPPVVSFEPAIIPEGLTA